MRRFQKFVLVLTLALVCPAASFAGGAAGDPNGLVAVSPAMMDWVQPLLQVLFAWIGI